MKKLLEVKKQIGTLSKNSSNPFFKSKYLELSDLLECVEPLLQEAGILLLQPIVDRTVSTELWDVEAGMIVARSTMSIPENITDPQKMGSCITYLRRYTLKSLLAIAEQDDDGNTAKKSKPLATKETLEKAKAKGATIETVKKHYKVSKQQELEY